MSPSNKISLYRILSFSTFHPQQEECLSLSSGSGIRKISACLASPVCVGGGMEGVLVLVLVLAT